MNLAEKYINALRFAYNEVWDEYKKLTRAQYKNRDVVWKMQLDLYVERLTELQELFPKLGIEWTFAPFVEGL